MAGIYARIDPDRYEAAHPGGNTLFNPFPSELLTSYPVTPKMNRPTFNSPEDSTPLEPAIS